MAEATEQKTEMDLYHNKKCPFGYRAWLTCEHKKIQYKWIRVSLAAADKEDFFKEAYAKALGRDPSNEGKVPIVAHNGKFITESMVCARYLDHAFNDESKYGAPLLPNDPFERAAVEAMIAWFGDSGWLKSQFGVMAVRDDQEKKAAAIEAWKKKWQLLSDRLCQFTKEGLFLSGGRLSMFEVAVWSFFERLCVVNEVGAIPVLTDWMNEFPRVKSWYDACRETQSIKKLLQEPKFFVDGYKARMAKK